MPRPSLKVVLIACVVIVGCLLVLGFCQARKEARTAKSEGRVAVATGRALDKVASETPKARQEQQEKQREVDAIEGSDQRLPDGYGAELERVRRGGERRNP